MRTSKTSQTSRTAAKDNKPRSQRQREQIAVALLTPSTRDELSVELGIPVASVCPRVSELFEGWLVQATGERRPTRTGSRAEVIELSEMGLDFVEELLNQ